MVRIKDDSGTHTKCLLDPFIEETDQLEAAARATDWEREIAIQLMLRCGLRADEVSYPTAERLRWSSGGGCWLLEVLGKNTKGGAQKTRDAWVPEVVAQNIQRFVSERDRDDTEPLVSVATSSVRRWVREAANKLVGDGGGDRWRSVSRAQLNPEKASG